MAGSGLFSAVPAGGTGGTRATASGLGAAALPRLPRPQNLASGPPGTIGSGDQVGPTGTPPPPPPPPGGSPVGKPGGPFVFPGPELGGLINKKPKPVTAWDSKAPAGNEGVRGDWKDIYMPPPPKPPKSSYKPPQPAAEVEPTQYVRPRPRPGAAAPGLQPPPTPSIPGMPGGGLTGRPAGSPTPRPARPPATNPYPTQPRPPQYGNLLPNGTIGGVRPWGTAPGYGPSGPLSPRPATPTTPGGGGGPPAPPPEPTFPGFGGGGGGGFFPPGGGGGGAPPAPPGAPGGPGGSGNTPPPTAQPFGMVPGMQPTTTDYSPDDRLKNLLTQYGVANAQVGKFSGPPPSRGFRTEDGMDQSAYRQGRDAAVNARTDLRGQISAIDPSALGAMSHDDQQAQVSGAMQQINARLQDQNLPPSTRAALQAQFAQMQQQMQRLTAPA